VKYQDYKTIALTVIKRNGLYNFTDTDIHDMATCMWESHERYLDSINGHDRELSDEESLKLKRILYIRAKGAAIDILRFKTFRTKNNNLGIRINDEILGNEEYVSYNPANIIHNYIDLKYHPKFYLVNKYIQGRNYRELGEELNITESGISRAFDRIKV